MPEKKCSPHGVLKFEEGHNKIFVLEENLPT